MICELCGTATSGLREVLIEGTKLMVCPKCANMGTNVKKTKKPEPSSVMEERLQRSKKRGKPRDIYSNEEKGLSENYSELIKNARQKKGLTREEMGRSINEKASVIGKLENRDLHPDDRLRKKIESFLGISLLTTTKVQGRIIHHKKRRNLTLGDLIKVKKDKTKK